MSWLYFLFTVQGHSTNTSASYELPQTFKPCVFGSYTQHCSEHVSLNQMTSGITRMPLMHEFRNVSSVCVLNVNI